MKLQHQLDILVKTSHLWWLSTLSHLLLRKEDIRPNIWPEIFEDLSLWWGQWCQTMSAVLDILSATVQLVPDLLAALAILSDATARRSEVDWKDLKPYWN